MENNQLIDKNTSNIFRGIAAVMVISSHYAEWFSWFIQTEGNREIFRVALTKLGVYGVDIFFLFSGYAMVVSLNGERMSLNFVWKRIRNVYLPYFILVGILELLSGGFTSLHDFMLFLTGYDYWYMNVLFIFYIGFMVIYALIRHRVLRIFAFSIFTYAYSYWLYSNDMHEFWYVSNIAFVMGIIIGEYGRYVKKIIDRAGIPISILLSLVMVYVVRSGLYADTAINGYPEEYQVWFKIGATFFWTLLVIVLASIWRIRERISEFLGKNSLYLYLTHTYIFMRCVNGLETAIIIRFAISAAVTVIVSFLCGLAFTLFKRLLSRLVTYIQSYI